MNSIHHHDASCPLILRELEGVAQRLLSLARLGETTCHDDRCLVVLGVARDAAHGIEMALGELGQPSCGEKPPAGGTAVPVRCPQADEDEA